MASRIRTAGGRELTRSEFDMECRAALQMWDINDEMREDVLRTLARLVKDPDPRYSLKASENIVRLIQQNLDILKVQLDEKEKKTINLVQNNVNLTPEQEGDLHSLLRTLSGEDHGLMPDETDSQDAREGGPTKIDSRPDDGAV